MLSAIARGVTHDWAGIMGRAFIAHVRSMLSAATPLQLARVLHSPALLALGCLVHGCNRKTHGAAYGRLNDPNGIGMCSVSGFMQTFEKMAAFPGVTEAQLKNCFTNQSGNLYEALRAALIRADAQAVASGIATMAQLQARKQALYAVPKSCPLCAFFFKPDATIKSSKPSLILEKAGGENTGRTAWGCCTCRTKYNHGKLLRLPRFLQPPE